MSAGWLTNSQCQLYDVSVYSLLCCPLKWPNKSINAGLKVMVAKSMEDTNGKAEDDANCKLPKTVSNPSQFTDRLPGSTLTYHVYCSAVYSFPLQLALNF